MKKHNATETGKTLLELCLEKGIRATSKRKVVFAVLESSTEHLNAEKVYRLAKKKDASIGQATVYRTLRLLKEYGIVEPNTFGQEHKHFESPTKDHHDHLVCDVCGKIVEFCSDELEKMKKKMAGQHGFRMVSHRLDIHGICPDCRSRER